MKTIRLAVCLLCLAFALPACSDSDDPQESDEVATGGQSGGSSTGGESGDGGSGGTPESFESCEELSEEDCDTDGPCILVSARKLGTDDAGDPCVSEERVTECRTQGNDCQDTDGGGYWCDDDDQMWQTPQGCGPSGMPACEAPDAHPMECL